MGARNLVVGALTIVMFHGMASKIFVTHSMNADERRRGVDDLIAAQYRTGGSTNIQAGLQLANDLAQELPPVFTSKDGDGKEARRYRVLLTDGEATSGIADPMHLAAMTDESVEMHCVMFTE